MSLAVTHSSKTEFTTRNKWGKRSQAKLKYEGEEGEKKKPKTKIYHQIFTFFYRLKAFAQATLILMLQAYTIVPL